MDYKASPSLDLSDDLSFAIDLMESETLFEMWLSVFGLEKIM